MTLLASGLGTPPGASSVTAVRLRYGVKSISSRHASAVHDAPTTTTRALTVSLGSVSSRRVMKWSVWPCCSSSGCATTGTALTISSLRSFIHAASSATISSGVGVSSTIWIPLNLSAVESAAVPPGFASARCRSSCAWSSVLPAVASAVGCGTPIGWPMRSARSCIARASPS